MKPFTPRKKKPVKLSMQTKTVRINNNTQIEVSVSISDDDAIERYYQRHTTATRPSGMILYPKTKEECFKDDQMPPEVLAGIMDDTELPEEE